MVFIEGRPKVDWARHLHHHQGLDPECFVLFSSASSGFGSAGEAADAAAGDEAETRGASGLRCAGKRGRGRPRPSRRRLCNGIRAIEPDLGIQLRSFPSAGLGTRSFMELRFDDVPPVVTVCP